MPVHYGSRDLYYQVSIFRRVLAPTQEILYYSEPQRAVLFGTQVYAVRV